MTLLLCDKPVIKLNYQENCQEITSLRNEIIKGACGFTSSTVRPTFHVLAEIKGIIVTISLNHDDRAVGYQRHLTVTISNQQPSYHASQMVKAFSLSWVCVELQSPP